MELSNLTGPAIGAVIGYGTNWLAIKMLFRPVKPIKIGRFTLPFTPGIIPKRKPILAKAIGEMVGNHLFTSADLTAILLSSEMENAVVQAVMEGMQSEETLREILLKIADEEVYEQARESLKLVISEKIKEGMLSSHIEEVVIAEGKKIVQAHRKGMLKMLLTDDLINTLLEPMKLDIRKYIQENSLEKIVPIVEQEIGSAEKKSVQEVIREVDIDEERCQALLTKMYENFVTGFAAKLLEKMNIAKVVEEKVEQMDVLELEKLILSVMKKELSAIVNLGALIGLVLGTLNVFLG